MVNDGDFNVVGIGTLEFIKSNVFWGLSFVISTQGNYRMFNEH